MIVGTTGTVPPYSYYKGTDLNGYDIELARRFAAWLGAGLEFSVYDFGGIIPAAAAGKIDCIMSNLEVDTERQENFTFSDPVFEQPVGIMVRSEKKLPTDQKSSLSDLFSLDGVRIGTQTGTSFGPMLEKKLPGCTNQLFQFDD